jgi:phosphoribosylformimino-5-aminoimidazole carboxamide ribotide isomerase
MRVVAVLDLLGGQVVHGIAGRRSEYQPIVSRLTPSADPVAVARAFREGLGLQELYLADLDAIAGRRPALSLYSLLRGEGFHLWVDAGIRTPEMVVPLLEAGVERLVVGLETISGPDALASIVAEHGDRVVFSLDLREGKPLGNLAGWEGLAALDIASQAIRLGVKRLLVLDLARVGIGAGTGTEALLSRLSEGYPGVERSAGGGVHGLEDLKRLRSCGVQAVLAASALHDGRLDRAALEQI